MKRTLLHRVVHGVADAGWFLYVNVWQPAIGGLLALGQHRWAHPVRKAITMPYLFRAAGNRASQERARTGR